MEQPIHTQKRSIGRWFRTKQYRLLVHAQAHIYDGCFSTEGGTWPLDIIYEANATLDRALEVAEQAYLHPDEEDV